MTKLNNLFVVRFSFMFRYIYTLEYNLKYLGTSENLTICSFLYFLKNSNNNNKNTIKKTKPNQNKNHIILRKALSLLLVVIIFFLLPCPWTELSPTLSSHIPN